MLLMTFCTNAQNVTKISPKIKMTICDNQITTIIYDNNDYDNINNQYVINFGEINSALLTLNKIECDLLKGESFAQVSYKIHNNTLNALLGVNANGGKYILINDDHQYEIQLSHIKKIKKVINKYITNEH